MGTIAENIASIKVKICKIKPEAELIAVSKTHDVSKIREAIMAGQKLFAENRVQEAAAKFPQLRAEFADLKLHLIGPLQTNKVKEALGLFDVIQTIDREKLAVKVSEFQSFRVAEEEMLRNSATQQLITKEFFIQVNIGEEPQKAGIAPQRTEGFYKFCINDLKLNVIGLMCIPPAGEAAFMYFALLKKIALKLKAQSSKLKLSMGMSADYEEALEMGADYIRAGRAIFGERRL